ncbi:MAG: 50S ribosomal protein L25 [Candidatus Peribacteraceae bacterium]|nr:50S ribosomal protein L25 [Candidatus Peribacteraceae bacterium]
MIPLSVQARMKESTPQQLRRQEIVPCVVYGNDTENISVECDHKTLLKTFTKAGESTLVELEVNGKKIPVLFHAITFHPVTDKITHVDFYAVNMKKEIEAHVPIHLVGESPAIKELGAVLVTSADHLTIKCLPANLPHALEANISSLAAFGDTLTVAEIPIPQGIKVLEDAEHVIASVQEPRRAEEETVAAPEEGAEGTAEGEEAKEGSGEANAEEGGKEKSARKES